MRGVRAVRALYRSSSHPIAELVQHYFSRHPWEALKKYLANVSVTELYGGFTYIAVGERDK